MEGLGASWERLGAGLEGLEASWEGLGASWEGLGASWEAWEKGAKKKKIENSAFHYRWFYHKSPSPIQDCCPKWMGER